MFRAAGRRAVRQVVIREAFATLLFAHATRLTTLTNRLWIAAGLAAIALGGVKGLSNMLPAGMATSHHHAEVFFQPRTQHAPRSAP